MDDQLEPETQNPSILSHTSIGVRDLAAALSFYDRVLATLGARRVLEHGDAVGYGKQFPEFWVQAPFDGQQPSVGNGTHFGFIAASRDAVDQFYREAMAAGAVDDGAPGVRPDYGPQYYGCFVRDLDGHKIEAACWDEASAPS